MNFWTILFAAGLIFTSCTNNTTTTVQQDEPTANNDAIAPSPKTVADKIATDREVVSNNAAASYSKKVPHDLNDWYFKVELFETAKTFTYTVKMQYEEMTGEDDITFPNLGQMPTPVIKAGIEPYSAIIGFMDNKGNYKEYKKVLVENGNMSLKTLKYYSVSTIPTKK